MMKVRDPNETVTYLQIKTRPRGSKKFKTRTMTVYGSSFENIWEVIQNALKQASKAETGRAEALPA
jgi:hypothetical protein